MADKKKEDELEDLEEEEELEPEGCVGVGWGTLLVLALIVILAGLAAMGSWQLTAAQEQQMELEMMRDQAFQLSVGNAMEDLTKANEALAANNPDAALASLEEANDALLMAAKQAPSPTGQQFVYTARERCSETKGQIEQRLRKAATDAQEDVSKLLESVKLLRRAE